MTKCKNCDTPFEGKFCPACGQKAKTTRITFKQVLKDVRDQFSHFDHGFFYTAKELIKRPGHSIRDYLAGKRVKHFKPLKFLVWATALNFFVIQVLGFQERLIERLEQERGIDERTKHIGETVMNLVAKYPSLITLLMIPMIAFVAWLLLRNKKLNYAEHFTMNAYLMGQLSLITIANNLAYQFWRDISIEQLMAVGIVQWVIWVLYYGWAYSQFLDQPKKVTAWLKGVGVLLIGYFLMTLLITAAVSTLLPYFKPQLESWFLK